MDYICLMCHSIAYMHSDVGCGLIASDPLKRRLLEREFFSFPAGIRTPNPSRASSPIHRSRFNVISVRKKNSIIGF